MTVPGLRERKKQQTRENIAAVALDLFERKGFHATTIRDIAKAADVAPRTVSGYFPVKEQLVFVGQDEFFADLDRHLTERPAGVDAASALREFLRAKIQEPSAADAAARARMKALIEAEPALRAYERASMEQAERLVARAVAVDLGLDAGSLLPHMVGAATVAALDALGRELKDAEDPIATALGLVDDAMRFIGAGVRGLTDD